MGILIVISEYLNGTSYITGTSVGIGIVMTITALFGVLTETMGNSEIGGE